MSSTTEVIKGLARLRDHRNEIHHGIPSDEVQRDCDVCQRQLRWSVDVVSEIVELIATPAGAPAIEPQDEFWAFVELVGGRFARSQPQSIVGQLAYELRESKSAAKHALRICKARGETIEVLRTLVSKHGDAEARRVAAMPNAELAKIGEATHIKIAEARPYETGRPPYPAGHVVEATVRALAAAEQQDFESKPWPKYVHATTHFPYELIADGNDDEFRALLGDLLWRALVHEVERAKKRTAEGKPMDRLTSEELSAIANAEDEEGGETCQQCFGSYAKGQGATHVGGETEAFCTEECAVRYDAELNGEQA